ncbi:hypothetical protein [Streptomyces sp. NPDC001422]|uniref:hypothetical protein n=1 Tax=Streptomyces sp. NPDC001422 TaxID=3364575 RepID=UPI0036A66D0A
MQLRLKYAPIPENGARFAADIVASAAEVSRVELDYTPDSLTLVDDILEGFRADGITSDQVAETLFGFGCYIGEVLARHEGGCWREATEQEVNLFSFPMVIELPAKQVCNPIGKVFKRMENGPEDNLRYFYTVFTSAEPR